MPWRVRLSDGLGHAGALARNCEGAEFLGKCRQGAEHVAAAAGVTREIVLSCVRREAARTAAPSSRALAKRDGVGVGRMVFISSVRHCRLAAAKRATCLGTGEAGACIDIRRAFRLGVGFGCLSCLPCRHAAGVRGSSPAEAEHRGDAGALHFYVA